MQERPRKVGVAWYRPDEYDRLRALMSDAGKLPADYASWLRSAEQVAGEVARSGIEVVRVVVETDAFRLWCEAKGIQPDGAARARYAQDSVAGQL